MCKLVNLTQHTVVLIIDGVSISLPSCGVARVTETVVEEMPLGAGGLGLIPVVRKSLSGSNIEGLPPVTEGVMFIVSAIVANAAPDWRTDIFVPDDVVRKDGVVVGCRRLARLK